MRVRSQVQRSLAERSTIRPLRRALLIAASGGLLALSGGTEAFAVSREVRDACRQEYFDYCNMHKVGSPGLRQCMRRNQRRLSDRCVSALISSGEASAGERARANIARRHRSERARRD